MADDVSEEVTGLRDPLDWINGSREHCFLKAASGRILHLGVVPEGKTPEKALCGAEPAKWDWVQRFRPNMALCKECAGKVSVVSP